MANPILPPLKISGNPTRDPQLFTTLDHQGRSLKLADPKATRALVSLMDMYAVLGGAASHYGGPAALAELMSALHALVLEKTAAAKKQWHELYHLINDAGHCENGLYALKANYGWAGLDLDSLKKFRSIESGLTGHGEVHCFPEGVFLSNGPLGSAFPQTQGLAMAEALSKTPRTTVCTMSDGASMEGEAKEAFAAIPGYAAQGKLGPFVLIISDNNTKLSGRIDKDSFSMTPTFRSLEPLGWKVIKVEQGNDLAACVAGIDQALNEVAKNPKVPVCVHAKTVKGIGTSKTAESSSGGHGFPLKSPTELPAFLTEIYAGNAEAVPKLFASWIQELIEIEKKQKASGVKDSGEKIQKGVSAALIRARKEGLPIVSLAADLPGSTGTAEFRKEFPHASFDVGVAEANMVSAGAGFSKLGYIPVVDTFAQFGVTKGALPLTMASLSEAPIIAIYSHTGFQDAADGASHQALTYLSMVGGIPHVKVYGLSCSEEAEALVYQGLQEFAEARRNGKTPDSLVFFLGRENFPKTYGAQNYDLHKAQWLVKAEGRKAKAVVVTTGSLVPEALGAAKTLQGEGVAVHVLNQACMNKIDSKTLREAVESSEGHLIVAEDHQSKFGLSAMLAQTACELGLSVRLTTLAVKNEFGQSAYKSSDLYRKHGLDAKAIAQAVTSKNNTAR